MTQHTNSTKSDRAASSPTTERREQTVSYEEVQVDEDATEDASGGEDGTGAPSPASDRCDTCGETIGPRAYRLSRVVEDGLVTQATHYCSEECFPDESTRSKRGDADSEDGASPRDWSYCR